MEWTLFLLAVAGVLAHLLSTYINSLTVKEVFDWKKSLLYNVYAIVILGVLVFLKDEFNTGIVITKATAFFIGYFSDSMLKNFTMFNPFPDK